MAKKVRRKLEEEEAAAFEFPTFDELGFVTKEFELAGALVLAVVIAVVIGVVDWILTRAGLPWFAPFGLGVLLVAVSPFLIGRLRRRSDLYTKGDWAGLIALEFFGFLALWFVLVNVTIASGV